MKTVNLILLNILLLASTEISAQNEVSANAQTDSIDYTEGMLENVDSIIAAWNLNNFYHIDSIPLQTSNFDSIDQSVIIDRLKRIPSVIEMTYNDVVAKYIKQYTTRLGHSVSYMLGMSNFFVPIFEEALLYYSLPLELKYLPVIESAYNPKARSRVGAMGLWQFMPSTARGYGLVINSLVDERCDPVKSSYAAAKYLKELYEIFNDWTLVIAAYNCGPNNINKAIHRAGGEKNFWKMYSHLPRETRGYVPAFIAANYAMNYYSCHNIVPMKASISVITDTIVLNKDVRMEEIASLCDISVEEIRALNPQYKTTLIPGYKMKCTLRMPHKQLVTFIDAKNSKLSDIDKALALNKTVDGEAVNKTDTAAAENNKETVDDEETNDETKKVGRRSRSSRRYASHTIRQGETLSDIARRNHTTVKKLQQLNGIKGTNIRAGKKIRVK